MATDHNRALAVASALLVEAAAARVIAVLKRGGVLPILLKGPSFARFAPDGARLTTDLDLLVSPARIESAAQLLAADGFAELLPPVPGDRPRHARVFRPPHGDQNALVDVDLHRTLVGIGVGAETAWSQLSRETGPLVIGGTTVSVLIGPAMVLHAVLHAAQHGPRGKAPISDLEVALAMTDDDMWDSVVQLALRLKAEPAVRAGLALTEAGRARLGDPRLGSEETMEAVLRQAGGSLSALDVEWLLSTRGTRARLRFILNKVVPPPTHLRVSSRLARHGRVGLALGYLVRLVRLVPRFFRTLVAWRRAARAFRR